MNRLQHLYIVNSTAANCTEIHTNCNNRTLYTESQKTRWHCTWWQRKHRF